MSRPDVAGPSPRRSLAAGDDGPQGWEQQPGTTPVGFPRVFAELVAGGSLRSWIDSGRLYHGDPPQVLERLLDVAIQLARGLQHSHEVGVVHQDVKPGTS